MTAEKYVTHKHTPKEHQRKPEYIKKYTMFFPGWRDSIL